MIKKCKLCGKEFEPNKHQQKYCSSECSEEAIRKQRQQYYLEHKEKMNEYNRKWKKANKEKMNEYNRQWREANKEKCREYYRKYYWKNHEKILKYQREYYKNRYISKALAECRRTHNDCYDCDMPVGECRYD